MHQTQKRIHKLIKTSKDPKLTAIKVSEQLGVSRTQVNVWVGRMIKEGLLVEQPWVRVPEK